MADEESKLLRDFKIRGIAASEFDTVRGTMCTKDEFGGWGSDLSAKPYQLNDGRGVIGSRSERMSYAEALAVRDSQLCIHGNPTDNCQFKQPGQATCRVAVTDGKPMF
jgi:hypothetical protein